MPNDHLGDAEAYLADKGWHDAQVVAMRALKGEQPSGAAVPGFRNSVLRWAITDSGPARIHWEAFHSRSSGQAAVLRDRDEYVAQLWSTIDDDDGSLNRDLRELIFSDWRAREYYRRQLFLWFVLRFDPTRAFRIYRSPVPAAVVYAILPILSIAISFGFWKLARSGACAAAGTLLGGGGVVLLGFLVTKLPEGRFAEAMFPRLAAAIAIGYLFLTSAGILSTGIARGTPAIELLVALVLALMTFFAIVFHASRRIHPTLPWTELCRRTLFVFAMGVTYSALGVGILGPLLTLDRALFPDRLRLDQGILFAAIAFALGMALELAWEEKPLTEPL